MFTALIELNHIAGMTLSGLQSGCCRASCRVNDVKGFVVDEILALYRKHFNFPEICKEHALLFALTDTAKSEWGHAKVSTQDHVAGKRSIFQQDLDRFIM